eukprot:COSAG06_NODE_21_length_33796_cov_70.184853_16_plen_41_part_00
MIMPQCDYWRFAGYADLLVYIIIGERFSPRLEFGHMSTAD